MQYFLGIDGGGTKSRLIIADENLKKISITLGNSINIFSVGEEKAFSFLHQLIKTAINEQNISINDVKRICVASAGLAREYDIKVFDTFFKKNYPTLNTIFTTDIRALLVGAFKNKDGICLISGTGSVAIGQDSNNNIIRSGGFGWRLGDEGSASYIVQEAIKRSLKSLEKRDLETNMLPDLLSFFNLKKIDDLIQYFHNPSLDKATVASAAYIVTDYARNNDLLALDILKDSAKELFKLVLSVNNRLPLIPTREIITAGGVFEHDEIVNNFFNNEINNYNLNNNQNNILKRIPSKNNALEGALYIAKNT